MTLLLLVMGKVQERGRDACRVDLQHGARKHPAAMQTVWGSTGHCGGHESQVATEHLNVATEADEANC